jgi:hypothetical protein
MFYSHGFPDGCGSIRMDQLGVRDLAYIKFAPAPNFGSAAATTVNYGAQDFGCAHTRPNLT